MQSGACWDLGCEVIDCSQNELLVIKTLPWQFWCCWGSGSTSTSQVLRLPEARTGWARNADPPAGRATLRRALAALGCRWVRSALASGAKAAHPPHIPGCSCSQRGFMPRCVPLVTALPCGVVLPPSQSTAQAGADVGPLPGGVLSLQQPPATRWLLHQPGRWPALLQLTKSRTSTLLPPPAGFLHRHQG